MIPKLFFSAFAEYGVYDEGADKVQNTTIKKQKIKMKNYDKDKKENF